ncbi:hypothetical protein R6Q59_025845 [Mikania micrantha]
MAFHNSGHIHLLFITIILLTSVTSGDDAAVLCHRVRLPVLDGDRSLERLFPVRDKLPDGFAGLQRRLSRRRSSPPFQEKGMQWNWGMGDQFGAQC